MNDPDPQLGARILKHLVDISASRCSITEQDILAEPDETTREILAGLLMLHEDLELREQRRQASVAELTALAAELEHRVAAQAQAILALSTPFIEVVPGILVLPLIGVVDTARAEQIMEQALAAVSEHKASVLIIDVTGVPTIDGAVTRVIISTAQAVSLLGAEAIFSGMSPRSALALVQLGLDVSMATPKATLAAALAAALAMTGRRISDAAAPPRALAR